MKKGKRTGFRFPLYRDTELNEENEMTVDTRTVKLFILQLETQTSSLQFYFKCPVHYCCERQRKKMNIIKRNFL
jgi:hypothetical protein